MLKNHTKCLWRGSPTVGPTSSSVRLHIYNVCAITNMTEISLIVTLNNHIHPLTCFRNAGFRFCVTLNYFPACASTWKCRAQTDIIRHRKKKEEIWLSPMTKSATPKEKSVKQRDNTKTPPATLITQRLRTDLGRSVGWTIITQPVWLNRFTGSQPSH